MTVARARSGPSSARAVGVVEAAAPEGTTEKAGALLGARVASCPVARPTGGGAEPAVAPELGVEPAVAPELGVAEPAAVCRGARSWTALTTAKPPTHATPAVTSAASTARDEDARPHAPDRARPEPAALALFCLNPSEILLRSG